eukprot:TRINITY_DN548_c0_g1_i1.p1 TRINITY_DN548_c0_g1~~TRINITY_DN548_c0_g1_i1.p1  ORF type:complete len:135 (-),score=12.42 TRINITY_DN548_c0_g1_i1:93-497(-)
MVLLKRNSPVMCIANVSPVNSSVSGHRMKWLHGVMNVLWWCHRLSTDNQWSSSYRRDERNCCYQARLADRQWNLFSPELCVRLVEETMFGVLGERVYAKSIAALHQVGNCGLRDESYKRFDRHELPVGGPGSQC